MSPDVDVFHFLALAFSNEIKDVKVLEISMEVVSEIDAVGWEAACCSPVGGVGISFAPDKGGKDPSLGRPRFVGHCT